MANLRNSNSYYIDGTLSTLAVKNIKLTHLMVTSTSSTSELIIKDITTGATKLHIRLAGTDDLTTRFFDFSANPIVFPNGINPSTVTNCVATCLIQESRG